MYAFKLSGSMRFRGWRKKLYARSPMTLWIWGFSRRMELYEGLRTDVFDDEKDALQAFATILWALALRELVRVIISSSE
jgi:hypothetical protein